MTDNIGPAPADNSAAVATAAPATAPATVAAAAPTTQPASPASWADAIQDQELLGWVQNKGFHKKEPGEVARSYQHLEKLFGADRAGRTVEIPASADDKDAWNAVYSKLGRPDSPEQYNFKVEGGDEEFLGWARNTFHEIGLPDAAAQSLVQKYVELETTRTQAAKEQQDAKIQQEFTELRKEWGAAFENKVATAKLAADKLGFNKEKYDALDAVMGPAQTVRFIAGLAEKLGEDTFVGGESESVMTPAQAMDNKNSLVRDPLFVDAWTNKGHPGHAAAVKKMADLTALALGRKPS